MSLQIETLRGLACLLLVAHHVVGADASLGLQVTDGPVCWLNDGMAYLRMPLFTFLSGLVCGLLPFGGDSRSFLTGKMRRLLVPMLVVGTLFAILQAVTPGTNSSAGPWYLWHVQPIDHFWFVESLFWVFVLVWVLERWSLLRNAQSFALVLALACGVYLTVRGWSWFGIEGAIYLLPYLFHVFFTAASRIALDRLQIDVLPLDLVLGVVMGLFGPMMVERLASRFNLTALMLLGKSHSNRAELGAKLSRLALAN